MEENWIRISEQTGLKVIEVKHVVKIPNFTDLLVCSSETTHCCSTFRNPSDMYHI